MIEVLSTKFYMPTSGKNIIERRPLLEAMGSVAGKRLILITAPAGYGKSTLAVQWLSEQHQTIVWLSLDEDDNQPTRFIGYLIHAIRNVADGFGSKLLVALQAEDTLDFDTILTAFINELVAIKQEIILALDDFHFIENPVIEKALQFLLKNLPTNVMLLITSRITPDISLARLRAQGLVLEIHAHQLQFELGDTTHFIREELDFELEERLIDILQQRTEGWVAGLQLATLSLARHPDPEAFVTRFGGDQRYIMDFLTDEVLGELPETVFDFLLETSILKRLSAPLCDTMLQTSDSQSMLDTLLEQNLFLVTLDEYQKWYRYHHLFADLLLYRLKQRESVKISDLHKRASQWFESHNDLNAAVSHAFQTEDLVFVASLLERWSDKMQTQGRFAEFARWTAQIPDTIFEAFPLLCTNEIHNSLMTGRIHRAQALLAHFERSDHQKLQNGVVETTRAMVATFVESSPTNIMHLCQEAIDALPVDDTQYRYRLFQGLGSSNFELGNYSLARRYYEQAQVQMEMVDDYQRKITNHFWLFRICLYQMDVDLAEQHMETIRILGEQYHARTGLTIHASHYYELCLAEILIEQNRVHDAEKHLAKLMDICQKANDWLAILYITRLLCTIDISRKHYDLASQKIAHVEPIIKNHAGPAWLYAPVKTIATHIRLYTDTSNELTRWIRDLTVTIHDTTIQYQNLGDYHNLLRYYVIYENDVTDASSLVSHLITDSRSQKRWIDLVKELLLKGTLLKKQSEENLREIMSLIIEALDLAKRGRLIHIFLYEGDMVSELLKWIKLKGLSHPYLQVVLNAVSAFEKDKSNPDALTQREIEVLHLLAIGLSNKAIAKELFITIGTVKRHAANIFSKLSVKNRTEAVVRARQQGLVD